VAFETFDFLVSSTAEPLPPLENALAEQAREDAVGQARAEREQAERQAASAERAEWLAIQNRILGDPHGHMAAARSAAAAAADEIADLRDRLAKAEARQGRARADAEFWATRMQAAEVSAQRANPLAAASQRAAATFAELRAAGRERDRAEQILRSRRPSARSAPPPFGAAGGDDPAPPPGCSRERYNANGYCGCWNCATYEDERQAAAAANGSGRFQHIQPGHMSFR
jgi:hypothetical protein